MALFILKVDIRWGWLVDARPRPVYPRERTPGPVVEKEAGWATEHV